MANAGTPGPTRVNAADHLDEWLTAKLGARPLAVSDLKSIGDHRFARGWFFTISVADAQLDVQLLIDERFPRSRPRVRLAHPPPFPSYPHVEDDGLVCVLSEVDELDPTKPIGIAKQVLAGAADILEQGISGANREDFRTEFISYWNPGAKGQEFRSIINPCEPTRWIRVWRGKHFYLVAENRNEIAAWLDNALGKPVASSERALLIWLDRPMLPSDYPSSPDDMRMLVESVGGRGKEMLDRLLGSAKSEAIVLIGANSGNGPCLAAVSISERTHSPGGKHIGVKGFREGRAPAQILRDHRRRGILIRSSVERADPFWIHGRDHNSGILELRGATVGVLGCGSLGSPVARLLAQAGVGRLVLVDPELMNWANVGRHGLGAGEVRGRKAKMLKQRLSRDFPHSEFFAHEKRWQEVLGDDPTLLKACDLLISTIGSWSQEGELNEWHIGAGRERPLLYGWTEPHGCASHAVVVGTEGGCLACGLNQYGAALFQVVDWPGVTLRREAACGAFFQPYGPSEITMCATLVADLALDVLLDRAPPGTHRAAAVRAPVIEEAGGVLSKQWIDASRGRLIGGNVEELLWPKTLDCPACQPLRRPC